MVEIQKGILSYAMCAWTDACVTSYSPSLCILCSACRGLLLPHRLLEALCAFSTFSTFPFVASTHASVMQSVCFHVLHVLYSFKSSA